MLSELLKDDCACIGIEEVNMIGIDMQGDGTTRMR
jgi:hypothetical protein